MAIISELTHEFHRGKVDGKGSCLFASIFYVNDAGHGTNSKLLRSEVVDYIRTHKNLHPLVLGSNIRCKTIQDYYTQLEEDNVYGGEIELQVVATVCHLVIHVVSIKKTAYNNYIINILNYGEDVESFKESAYILYDEDNKHYEPLYVINKENLNEISTIFQRNDGVIIQLMDKFIQKERGDNTSGQSGSNELELPTDLSLLSAIEYMDNMITPEAHTKFPTKRKLPDHAGLSLGKIIEEDLSLPVLNNNNNDFDKAAKSPKWDTDEISMFDKLNTGNLTQLISPLDDNNYESMTIEQLLQMDFSSSKYIEQPSTTDSSMNSTEEVEMKFEIDPALRFRGRTSQDFKPKNKNNDNGKLRKAKPPRYIADRVGHRSLNLLIPKTYLSAGLLRTCFEICIVTREIDGYTYINPYFMFQVDPKDPCAPNLNPMYKFLDSTAGLKACVDNLRQQLKLKLCVVVYKNKELMQVKQPLQIFSLPTTNNNIPPITTKYTNHRAFKNAFHLHDLRFAITLWQKQPGEKIFHRCNEMQYISEISTEDRKYKKSKT